ncbi:hypothetical protein CDAR_34751 [Caerostris darwini]|uniref:Transposase-associated domain-containing protein n=1 Tax=Caerostris darwini TaxID=1538125 RepID=A0AAV4RVS1_9ARAC|nr:hypothetical protein CDAR_34751 [Caerostris darwini]
MSRFSLVDRELSSRMLYENPEMNVFDLGNTAIEANRKFLCPCWDCHHKSAGRRVLSVISGRRTMDTPPSLLLWIFANLKFPRQIFKSDIA